MKEEYIRLIAELDRVLGSIRALWLEAKAPEETTKWRVRLDELMDERLRLMHCRDTALS
jgi:hypothetical protein